MESGFFSIDYKGYGIYRIFLCLLLQFLEDLSDRELERFICENAAARWFCQFDLTARTPDHSVFGRVRSKIGTNKLSKIFSTSRAFSGLKTKFFDSEAFSFSFWQANKKNNKIAKYFMFLLLNFFLLAKKLMVILKI